MGIKCDILKITSLAYENNAFMIKLKADEKFLRKCFITPWRIFFFKHAEVCCMKCFSVQP